MKLITFQTLYPTTNLAVYFSISLDFLSIKYVFTVLARNVLIFVSFYISTDLNITYLLELFFSQKCSNIEHVDWPLAPIIRAAQYFLVRIISKGS